MSPDPLDSTPVAQEPTDGDTPARFGFEPLDDVQARVLGCLLEKQLSTPEYYPLTLRATVAACNQKSNRDPVYQFDEKAVARALDHLREKKLAWMVHAAGSRTEKYEHRLGERVFIEDRKGLAVLCELMVRGPQTAGQLRARTERMHSFADRQEVQEVLDGLAARGVPLVVRLPHVSGHKEARYAQLLCGVPDVAETGAEAAAPARVPFTEDGERMVALEQKVAALTEKVEALEVSLREFRKQFE